MNLAGKVALITGGTKGIGAATAVALARAGVEVAVNGRCDDDEAQATCRAIRALGRRCELILADCAVPADCGRLVAAAAVTLACCRSCRLSDDRLLQH